MRCQMDEMLSNHPPEYTPKGAVMKAARADEDKNDAVFRSKEVFIRKTLETDPIGGFELLFRNYYQPLCSHAVRFVYNKEVAEDIVSEVFLSIWNKKLHEQIQTSFRAYLFTAIRNKCLNYLKWELERDKKDELGVDSVASNLLPDSIMEFDELYLQIEAIVESFPPQCQKVFLLSRFEGKSHSEIGDNLGISKKAIEAL
jgi:RNA polymerase sigma-70 factor (family 1)